MFFLAPAIIAFHFDSYKIVDIDRMSRFAGRLGQEVRETWTVSRGSDEFTVIVSPYHTHVARTTRFAQGDDVVIKNAPHGRVIRVALSEVKKA